MTKYLIRTSHKGWENGSGWTYGPDIYDEIDVTGHDFETNKSDTEYFDFIPEHIDIETYELHSGKDILWIRELIEIKPDHDFPEYGTEENVIYRAEEWESDLIETFFNLDQ